jgi:hypothetical protein
MAVEGDSEKMARKELGGAKKTSGVNGRLYGNLLPGYD